MSKVLQKLNIKHLWLGIISYIIFLTVISWYKYWLLAYNGMDLAIFENVLTNIINGNGWWSSIQGHSYLADHFTPWLIILLPFYYLWQSPLNLLLIQSIILGLTAYPVYLVAKHIINKHWGILLGLVWLINPLLWNINIHEWHIIPLAIPLLLLAYYFYTKKDLSKFCLFIILALLVREDVVVVTGMFAILALLDKRKPKWWLWPGLLSTGYFIFTMWLISELRPGGSRFLVYYDWLLTTTPIEWLLHLVNTSNIEMVLGLSLAFLLLPWFKPKYLILTLGTTIQFALLGAGGGNMTTDTHYASLFIPGLIISSICGIKKIKQKKGKIQKLIHFDPLVTKIVIWACLIYLLVVLGPGWGIYQNITKPNIPNLEKSLLANIPEHTIIASSYKYLPYLSDHQKLYSLHYILLGHQQFSDQPYPFQKPDYIILDTSDLTMYDIQFRYSRFAKKWYPDGLNNLHQLINNGYKLEHFNEKIMIWKKTLNSHDFEKPYPAQDFTIPTTDPLNFGPLSLRTYQLNNILKLAWQKQTEINQNYFIKISGDNFETTRPLALFQPTTSWKYDTIYESSIFLPPNIKKISIELVSLSGHIELDNWNSIRQIKKTEVLGQAINLNLR